MGNNRNESSTGSWVSAEEAQTPAGPQRSLPTVNNALQSSQECPGIILPSLRPNQRRMWIWWTPFNQCARGCEERWHLCPRTGVFPIAAPVSKVSPPRQVCEEMTCMRRPVAIRRFHNETGETSERTSRGGSYCRMESNLWVNEMLERFSIRLTGELRVPQCLNVFQLYNWGSWPRKLSINWSFMGGRHFLCQASCLFCLCFSMNEKTNDSEKGCSQKESPPPFSLIHVLVSNDAGSLRHTINLFPEWDLHVLLCNLEAGERAAWL